MGRHDTRPLHPSEQGAVREVLKRAAEVGRDQVEYLNEYGLLATQQWAASLRAETIGKLIEALEHVPAAALVGPRFHTGNWTANDIVDGVLRRLAEFEAAAAKGTWPK